MNTKVTLHFADGSSQGFVITAGDLYRFEKKYGKAALSRPFEEMSTDQQLFVAWSAAKRTGTTDLDLVPWLDTLTGADFGED